MSALMMEATQKIPADKKAVTVCLGKPTRAAACETKQPSLLCPCPPSPHTLSVVVGKVASKFAIKMAARILVSEILDPFEEF